MRAGWLIGVAMLAVAPLASAQSADYDFAYRYPAQAARIAPLKAWLEADKAKQRAMIARDAATSRREAKRDGFPFRKYEAQKEWKVVADTQRFLSLSVSDYNYSGGAHGGTASGGLLWDKRAGRRVDPKAVFVSPAALQAAVMPGWCRWMSAERTRRVGAVAGGDAVFGKCPPVKDVTVLLGSSNGRAFDRIGVIADQYVVGSYAEGQYEHTLPVTTAVLRAVKAEYRGSFVTR
ncbi:DUF4163 domain-containing protein [Sphingomonas sp. Leaf10]|uniref:DUF4163 domain-containing protein n=1 Tax=Sphingomonas sp. Leaf10 TaxID=1735676 RepID=UPI0006F7D19C|nr:DUF4163 domain-containing protein [Sphingomonas sp. Leaf10]KQM36319.1 hypothetical protein ASE59_16155 [Sphingomonas sp. Leaf10]